jgi:Ca-activated chloride channel family protein
MSNVTFASPGFLFLLLLIPALGVWYWFRLRSKESYIRYPTLTPFASIKPTRKEQLRHIPFVLRLCALALILIALARPQSTSKVENVYSEGIDIVLALDISSSMLAEDLQPNRIEAAKDVAQEFINGRTNDRIGLVIFSSKSFTQCPLTLDYGVLKTLVKHVKTGMIEDGTAIGLGLATAVASLKDSKAKSKIIILLTDGVNNRGEIDPLTAAQLAQTYGIRIYTVGVGTNGQATYPVQTQFGIRYQMIPAEVDESMLIQIADRTGGKYYRASDNGKLKAIYKEIDQLEKTRIEVRSYRHHAEMFYSFAAVAFILMIVDVGMSRIYLKKIP